MRLRAIFIAIVCCLSPLAANAATIIHAGVLIDGKSSEPRTKVSINIEEGRITGVMVGNALEFGWEWAANSGRGRFVSRDGGTSFSGTWGHQQSADNAGTWSAKRSQ